MTDERDFAQSSPQSDSQPKRRPGIAEFEKRIGYVFADPSRLEHALAHLSSTDCYSDSNERLEFLGDGILSFLVAESLFAKYPDLDEGRLTQFRSNLVSTKALSNVAQVLSLGPLITVGDSLDNRKLSRRVLAGVVEAVIAAIYLDGGIEKAKKFVDDFITSNYPGDPEQEVEPDNYKSLLQQLAQSFTKELPRYKLVGTEGPEHRKQYTVAVEFAGMTFSGACGWSKREAEQNAARAAYFELRELLAENG
ncbi:MAG: ribonuclease III [Planctomycetota bacterium]